MQIREGCIIQNKLTQQYIGKHYDHIQRDMELTTSLFSALRFADEANASEWMLNAMYAPKNTSDYEYVPVEITIKVKEAESNVQQEREHYRIS